jgi:hypothetical protein
MDPPIALTGKTGEPPAKGRVSSRWLAGTVLTGIAGTGLMYLAATNTVERGTQGIEKPQMIKPRSEPSHLSGELVVAARKGDKLVQRADIISARQTYKAPVVRKAQGGDVIRAASFTRVASPLALDTLGFADVIPSYNVARLVADASEDRAFEGPPRGVVDTDVSLQTRGMDEVSGYAVAPMELHEDEARAQAIEAIAASRRTSPVLPAQMLLAKAMRAPSEYAGTNFAPDPAHDPFSRLVVRMVPENVSLFPRIEAALARNTIEQRVLVIRSEENAEQVLRTLALPQAQARDAVKILARAGGGMDGGKRLKVSLQSLEPGAARSVVRVDLYLEDNLLASTGLRDNGSFSLIEIEKKAPARKRPTGEDEDEGGFTLFQSLHETMRKHNVPKQMIDEIVRVLFFDVDLQRAVNTGDSFELLIENDDADQPGELQMLSLTVGGETRKFFRFPLPEDEVVDYFDEQGRSAKKFLIRKPIAEGEMRSTFGLRRHPILGYYRMHNGVDWSAKMGTPILAAGNGTVRFADWDSGYGRRVEIQHTNGYVTTYNHMSGFGPKIASGVRVRQGQVVGYLGSTGLSTGPHLHYEVMINERHVDPLAIKLPRGRELEGPQLAEFKKQRELVDQVLKRAPGSAAAGVVPAAAPATAARTGG